MEDLLNKIEAAKMPAPSPIEQRWTCGSASHMSPASAAAQEGDSQDYLFSWVGIIMYLPTDNQRQRAAITKRWELNIKTCYSINERYRIYPNNINIILTS